MREVKHDNVKNPRNAQEKLQDSVDSSPVTNQNQGHNAKKEALGPNTKR